ncbi:hypothetical protein BV22DRAFT_1129787 [Leucogyrophana mollusca]|uniref:Uncharacterized protein n=1 Tax=Leucogyrophana mollusca TaxID=85980 RepID=A0ACB8BGI2_9AGAM|nr:hypothetical protein BV22DRAFT_1129787 [Leucogyrophana mollusca]
MPTITSPPKSSPQTEAPIPSVPTGDIPAKEVRAHEHARHRVKERREHAQAKERKERVAAWKAVGGTYGGGGRQNSRTTRRFGMEVWDGGEPEGDIQLYGHSVRAAPSLPRGGTEVRATEVKLADLISLRPRKAPKGRDSEFEVVPRVRSVIALDEFGYDVELDEPWEYVSLTAEQPAWRGMSYAQAATTGAM